MRKQQKKKMLEMTICSTNNHPEANSPNNNNYKHKGR